MSPQLPFFVYGTLRPGEVNHDLFLRGRTRAEAELRKNGQALRVAKGAPQVIMELCAPSPDQRRAMRLQGQQHAADCRDADDRGQDGHRSARTADRRRRR